MSDYLAFLLHAETDAQRTSAETFSSNTTLWTLVKPPPDHVTNEYVPVYFLKVEFHISSATFSLPVLQGGVRRMGVLVEASCLLLHFMGHRFWGVFTHLAHAMDSKWDFKSSHLFTASTLVTLPAWKASLGSWDYLSTSSWPPAGGGWDAGWHPADRRVTNGPFRCWYWHRCCRPPLPIGKTRPWNETILLI